MKSTFALFVGNRGMFPASLLAEARETIPALLESWGHRVLMMPADATRLGAVETAEEGRKFAAFLEAHPSVERVNYPGLTGNPTHGLARHLLDGFGGMLSFEVKGGVEAAERFMAHTTLPFVAPSLGGVETLITRPATTSHAGLSPRELEDMGIAEGLIRVSIGIEATEDLMEDFKQALEK